MGDGPWLRHCNGQNRRYQCLRFVLVIRIEEGFDASIALGIGQWANASIQTIQYSQQSQIRRARSEDRVNDMNELEAQDRDIPWSITSKRVH